MTTTFRTVFLSFAFGLLTTASLAQLDSTFATAHVVPGVSLSDSITAPDMISLTLQFDDISDVGELSVVVYDHTSGAPLFEFAKTRAGLLSENLLLTDHVEWPLAAAFPGQFYRIEISPRSLSGAYTRTCSLLFEY